MALSLHTRWLRSLIGMTTDVVLPTRSVPSTAAPGRSWQQLLRFAGVGLASTAAYALLYLLLRPPAGPFTANALALLLTAVANTAANRRLTFGVRGRSGVLGDHVVGLLAFAAGLALTSGALAALHAFGDPSRGTELVVLMTANALATLLRFVVLKLTFSRRERLVAA